MTQDTSAGIAIPEDIAAQVKDYVRQNFESGEPWSVTLARAIMAERERCAKIAECHFDDRGNSRSGHHSEMDWADGYRDATRGAARAIRQSTPTTGADHE